MAKKNKNERQLAPDPTKVRGGKKFIQADIYFDQVPLIDKYIQKKGGSVASTIRDGLDALLKPDYEH